MRFFLLFVVVMGLSACSGSPSENSNISNTEANAAVGEYSDARAALAAGTQFLDDDEVDKAISALNQAVRLDPDLAEAYFKLGVAYALVETRDSLDLEATPEPTSNSNEKKPKVKKANSEIAFEKAVAAYKKFIDSNPEDHQAYFNLGLAHNKLNEDEEAAKALKQAVKLNPEDSLYQTELGAILIKLAQYREAVEPLKKALELDPGNVEAEELLSDAEAGRKRIDYRSTPKPGSSADKSSSSNSSGADPRSSPAPAQTPDPRTRRTPAASNRN